ncbi:Allergen V5/Tpx-1 related protein [Jannaschia sp. CCS1]|nr:Allergen V5/Tpx-1 related protein [Jannaschia sp. CCS1]
MGHRANKKGSPPMKIRIASGLIALAVALTACTPTTGASGVSGGAGDVQRLSFGQSVDLASVGARLATLRARQGLSQPLSHSAALQAAAQAHADDMARTGNFSHRGANGSNLASRVRAAGYSACYANENIAFGQANTAQVFQDWMASSGHRRNILAARATQFGYAQRNGYAVLVLGRSC